jgi:hypothetical protein
MASRFKVRDCYRKRGPSDTQVATAVAGSGSLTWWIAWLAIKPSELRASASASARGCKS